MINWAQFVPAVHGSVSTLEEVMTKKRVRHAKNIKLSPATRKLIQTKILGASKTKSLTKQAAIWFKQLKPAELGGRDLAFFIKLVYRLRDAKRRQPKHFQSKPKVQTVSAPISKPTLTVRQAIAVYENYLLLIPALREADDFILAEGLKFVVEGQEVSIKKLN